MSERYLSDLLREAPKPHKHPSRLTLRSGQALAGVFVGVGVYAALWGRQPLWGLGLLAVGVVVAGMFWGE